MKTEANTRPDNRDIRQARLKMKQAMALFKRRLANLSKTDMLSYKKDKQAEALAIASARSSYMFKDQVTLEPM